MAAYKEFQDIPFENKLPRILNILPSLKIADILGNQRTSVNSSNSNKTAQKVTESYQR